MSNPQNLICISIDDRQVLIPRDAEATDEMLRWTVGLSPAEFIRRMSTTMLDAPHEDTPEAVIAVGAYAAAYAITFAAESADFLRQNGNEVVQLLRHGGQLLDYRLKTEPNGVITATAALRPREGIRREAA